MLSCKQVVDRADHVLAGELPWRQRVGVWVHLAICVHCRRYLRQLRVLLPALPHLRQRASEAQVDAVMARLQRTSSNDASDT